MIIRQMTGLATVKAEHLKSSAKRAQEISREFGWTTWRHVRRERNKMADLLTNTAMDGKAGHEMENQVNSSHATTWTRVFGLLSNDTNDEGAGESVSTLFHAFQ